MTAVLLGIPTYDGRVGTGTMMSALRASRRHEVYASCRTSSLLPKAFNLLWADAVSSGADYFVMLHADLEPDRFFVDTLVDISERQDADVVSCCVPIKDDSQLVSTAMWMFADREPHYRLTFDDLKRLPETFSSADVVDRLGVPGALVVNTGCWIARLQQPWCRRVSFTMESCIDWQADGTPYIYVLPEDWHFSRQLHHEGCSVYATQAVSVRHHGARQWTLCDQSLSV